MPIHDSKLSRQQKNILTWLLRVTDGRERTEGVLWSLASTLSPHVYNRSVSASFPRSLARLEKRGLILRKNPHQPTPVTRTTRVHLTFFGEIVAKRLSS
jgi:hypothetical protein